MHSPQHIIQTKKAVKRAFEYQVANKCFSLVEVVSTCPTNWGKTPRESTAWLEDDMLKFFKLGTYSTPDGETD